MKVRALTLLSTTLLLAACRINISVPTDGNVMTESGHYSCLAGAQCTIDVPDTGFAEVFQAVPKPGYLFAGWHRGDRYLCGGSLNPCDLDASLLTQNPQLLALLDADEDFYLQPEFLPDTWTRSYLAGDRVRFKGTLESDPAGEPAREADVDAQLDIQPPVYTLAGKPVLAARLSVTEAGSDVTDAYTVHFWQSQSGGFFQLTDVFGMKLLNTATFASGLSSIPAPLVAFTSFEIPFAIIDESRPSTPLATGTRSVSVGEQVNLVLPTGELATWPVTIEDRYSYAKAFDEFRTDQTIESETRYWISQVRGIVRMEIDQRVYSAQQRLLSREQLEIQATGFNF